LGLAGQQDSLLLASFRSILGPAVKPDLTAFYRGGNDTATILDKKNIAEERLPELYSAFSKE
jgi:hypothetical protein